MHHNAPFAPIRTRLLVVDDEAPIRMVMRRVLREHEVVEAASVEEARELLARDDAFDVVFCDIKMPEISGIELHKWLIQERPELGERLVFMTGGAFTHAAREHLASVANQRLEKPIALNELRRVIADVLVTSPRKS